MINNSYSSMVVKKCKWGKVLNIMVPWRHFQFTYVRDWVWENPTFSKFEILLYLASIMSEFTSLLNISIYNCTVSELQCFITQPLTLPILKAIKLHVRIRTHNKFNYRGFLQIRSHNIIILTLEHHTVYT